MLQFGEQTSLTERRADDATRDVMDFLKCEYMRTHVGEEFTGVVSAVTGFGLFIQLKDLYIEGLIHVTNLNSDYYTFDPVRLRLTGERSGKSYCMGDEVNIIVASVDLEQRKIDFELVGANNGDVRRKPAKKSTPRKKPAGSKKAPRSRKPALPASPERTVRKRSIISPSPAPDPEQTSGDPFAGAKKAKKQLMDGLKKAANKIRKVKSKKAGKKKSGKNK